MSESSETGLVLVEPQRVELGVLRADSPTGLLDGATAMATPLARLIEDRKLFSNISGRRYVRCEGWTTLAAMLGVTPHEVAVTEADGVFTAVVELRRLSDGQAVARASAECGAPDELDRQSRPLWANRPRYARRSMALTRATAKACRLAFSWVMVLAGYEATPAEEIPDDSGVVRLPGDAKKWDGHGGKAITDPTIPDKVLAVARKWLAGKDAEKNAALIEALDAEGERRRVAKLDAEMPEAVDRDDAGDAALAGTKV